MDKEAKYFNAFNQMPEIGSRTFKKILAVFNNDIKKAWQEIVERYFSRQERETLHTVSSDQILEAFFQGWTRKEAYSKALGQGVSQRWTQFSVPLTPGEVVELPDAGAKVGKDSQFALCPLESGAGYIAAVAAQGTGWHLHCWHWSWAEENAEKTEIAPAD